MENNFHKSEKSLYAKAIELSGMSEVLYIVDFATDIYGNPLPGDASLHWDEHVDMREFWNTFYKLKGGGTYVGGTI